MRRGNLKLTAFALAAIFTITTMPVYAEEIDWTGVQTGQNIAPQDSGDYHSKGSGLTIHVAADDGYKRSESYSGSVLVEETDVNFATGPGVGIVNEHEKNCTVDVEIGKDVTKLNASASTGISVYMNAGTGTVSVGGNVNVESYKEDVNAFGTGIAETVSDAGQYSGHADVTVGGNINIVDGAYNYGVQINNTSQNGSANATVKGDITATPKTNKTLNSGVKLKTKGVKIQNNAGTSTVKTGNITLNNPAKYSEANGVEVSNLAGTVSVETGNMNVTGEMTDGIRADVAQGSDTTIKTGNIQTTGDGAGIKIGEAEEYSNGKVTITTKNINSADTGIEESGRGNTVAITAADIQAVTDAVRILGGSAGDTTTITAGNLTAGDHAIAADLTNGGTLNVYVSGEMKSDNSLIQLTSGSGSNASDAGILNVTAWKITGDTDHLVEVVDQNKKPVTEGTNVQVNVDYIIKVDEVPNGQITLEGSNIRKDEKSGSYLAKADEKIVIRVKANDGYEVASASGGAASLVKNADGTYTLTVPAKGGVSLSAIMKVIQKQSENTGHSDQDGENEQNESPKTPEARIPLTTNNAPETPKQAAPVLSEMSSGTVVTVTDPAVEEAKAAIQNAAAIEFPDVPEDLSSRRLATAEGEQVFSLSTPVSAAFTAAQPGLALSVTEPAGGSGILAYRDLLAQNVMKAVDPNAVMLHGPFKIETFVNGVAKRDNFGTVTLNFYLGKEYDGIPLKVFYADAQGNYRYIIVQTRQGMIHININQVGFLFITT